MTLMPRMSTLTLAVLALTVLAACDRLAPLSPTPAPPIASAIPASPPTSSPTFSMPTVVSSATLPPSTPTTTPTPSPTPSPTISMLTVVPNATLLPSTPNATPPPPTEPFTVTSVDHCGELCSEEFWQSDVSAASVQIELDRGADPRADDGDGIPPLYLAFIYKADPEIIELLLEHGADPNAWDDRGGRTLLHDALTVSAFAPHPETASWFPAYSGDLAADVFEIIELLLEHGADASARDKYEQSTLSWYLGEQIESESYDADARIVKLLLEHGADVAMENDGGALAMTAAMWGKANPEVIRLLLVHGADATAGNEMGNTPLHMAVAYNAVPPVVELLLKNGADITQVNFYGETACDFAREADKSVQELVCP